MIWSFNGDWMQWCLLMRSPVWGWSYYPTCLRQSVSIIMTWWWRQKQPTERWLQFLFFLGWGETESTWYVGHYLAYCTSPEWYMMNMEQSVEWELAGETKCSEQTCPSVTLSTTNPIWPDFGSNPGRRGEKPAIKRLSYDTASRWLLTPPSHGWSPEKTSLYYP
jgi:hypothetical protein